MNIEELFDNEKWAGYGMLTTDDANLAIDYLKEEVMEYVAGLEEELIAEHEAEFDAAAKQFLEEIAMLEKKLAEEARLNDMGAERESKLLARLAELELRLGCCRDASTGKDLLIAELEAQVDSLQLDLIRVYQSAGNDLAVCQLKKLRGGA